MTAAADEGTAVLAALRARTSNGRIKPDPVPRELIARVIEAGTWAPNHRLTRPWRFVVLRGAARNQLGEAMAASLRTRLDDPTSERAESMLEKERGKPLRAPVVIAVAVVPSSAPGVVEMEEVAAVAAAVQNMLLAAEALGLGAIWRTGDAAYDPAIADALGLPADGRVLAFVYLGWPELARPRERAALDESLIAWTGDDA